MSETFVKAPDRLGLLLPWLNGDTDEPDLNLFLHGFVMSSGGAEPLGWTQRGKRTKREQLHLTKRQLDNLRRALLELLEGTEPGAPGDPWHSLPSLKFAVLRQRDKPDKLPVDANGRTLPKEAARRRRALENGFSLQLYGEPRHLVLYVFMRTLTESGAVLLSRCPAPKAGDVCDRLIIAGATRGRPREYCSDSCRVRAWQVKKGR